MLLCVYTHTNTSTQMWACCFLKTTLSIKVVIVFLHAFCPSTLLFLSAIRISGDDILRVCVSEWVCLSTDMSLFALTSFFSLPSTEARQQPTWCWVLNVCASHPYNQTTDRERESVSQPASYSVSVCSLLSFACSFVGALWRWLPPLSVVLPAVCFFFAWSYRSFSMRSPDDCVSLPLSVVSCVGWQPYLPYTPQTYLRAVLGHHLSLLLLFCFSFCCWVVWCFFIVLGCSDKATVDCFYSAGHGGFPFSLSSSLVFAFGVKIKTK